MQKQNQDKDMLLRIEPLSLTDSPQTTLFKVQEKEGRECRKSFLQLYTAEYLNRLAQEDRNYLANLSLKFAASTTSTAIYDAKSLYSSNSKYIFYISILFTVFLILSNIAGSKISLVFGFSMVSGLIFFPLTFILDDIITEVYGYKGSRRVIWTAFLANFIFVAGVYIVVKLPPNEAVWPLQTQMEALFNISPRIFVASWVAYLLGEFINSYIMAKMKIASRGKYFELRAITSTLFGALVENFLFCFTAFIGVVPMEVVIEISLLQFLCKFFYEVAMLPITKRVVIFLKKEEGIDHYDYHTDFNPFRLDDK